MIIDNFSNIGSTFIGNDWIPTTNGPFVLSIMHFQGETLIIDASETITPAANTATSDEIISSLNGTMILPAGMYVRRPHLDNYSCFLFLYNTDFSYFIGFDGVPTFGIFSEFRIEESESKYRIGAEAMRSVLL